MSAQVFVLTYLQLAALLFALNHFPEALPKRWDTISLYVGLCCKSEKSVSNYSDVVSVSVEIRSEGEPAKKKTRKSFSGLPNECKYQQFFNVAIMPACYSTKILYQPLLCAPDISSLIKPLILIPPVSTCCNSKITLRNRPSFPIVYTLSGTYIAVSYHGHCKTCSTIYHPTYYEVQKEHYLYDLNDQKYVQISSQTAFEVSYLDSTTNQLSICSSTFESIAELYTINHRLSDNLRLSKLLQFQEYNHQKCHGD